jgi:hypothetical protein
VWCVRSGDVQTRVADARVTPNRLNETEPSEFDAGRQVMNIGGVRAAVEHGIGHLITSLAG